MLSENVNLVCRTYSTKSGCGYEKCPIYGICRLHNISLNKGSTDANYKYYCREMNKAAKKVIENIHH